MCFVIRKWARLGVELGSHGLGSNIGFDVGKMLYVMHMNAHNINQKLIILLKLVKTPTNLPNQS